MDIDFCLDRGLMRIYSFHPDQYRLLIEGETIHYFTLPDPQVTCVYNQANWAYAIEGQGETVNEQRVAPTRIKVLTNNPNLQSPSMQSELVKLRMKMPSFTRSLLTLPCRSKYHLHRMTPRMICCMMRSPISDARSQSFEDTKSRRLHYTLSIDAITNREMPFDFRIFPLFIIYAYFYCSF